MEKINVGSSICGYEVKAVANGYCLAHNPVAPDPWVVWTIDTDGNGVHTGRYRSTKEAAIETFENLASPIVSVSDAHLQIEASVRNLIHRLKEPTANIQVDISHINKQAYERRNNK